MNLFGTNLPAGIRHRADYGLQLYYIGQVMAGQARPKSLPVDESDPAVNPEEAKRAVGLVEMVYHGIHNLDVNPQIQVPYEMLLAMNPSQIFELYAGTWLLKMDAERWGKAVNRHSFWQVVGAARKAVSENQRNSLLLAKLDDLCGKTYTAGEDGNLPARLQKLPQYVADGFMQAFTGQFRSPGEKSGYVPVSRMSAKKITLDQAVFGHFAGKFAEGERQFSIKLKQQDLNKLQQD